MLLFKKISNNPLNLHHAIYKSGFIQSMPSQAETMLIKINPQQPSRSFNTL